MSKKMNMSKDVSVSEGMRMSNIGMRARIRPCFMSWLGYWSSDLSRTFSFVPLRRSTGFQKLTKSCRHQPQDRSRLVRLWKKGLSKKMPENTKQSSKVSILLAWLLVGVPLAWGVYNTLLNSIKLFQAH